MARLTEGYVMLLSLPVWFKPNRHVDTRRWRQVFGTFHSIQRAWSCGDYKIIVQHDSALGIYPHQIFEGGVQRVLIDLAKKLYINND